MSKTTWLPDFTRLMQRKTQLMTRIIKVRAQSNRCDSTTLSSALSIRFQTLFVVECCVSLEISEASRKPAISWTKRSTSSKSSNRAALSSKPSPSYFQRSSTPASKSTTSISMSTRRKPPHLRSNRGEQVMTRQVVDNKSHHR